MNHPQVSQKPAQASSKAMVKRPAKQRFIPANAEAREFPAAAVIAYCYQNARGFVFLAYKGRQSKAARHEGYQTEAARDEYLARYVSQQLSNEDYKRSRQTAVHGLVPGDIVCSTWGCEQTNVTFFQVLRVPSARSAVVRQIEAELVEDDPFSMTGKKTPKLGIFAARSEELTRRATELHALTGFQSWHGSMRKWDGKPCAVTSYA